MSTPQPIPTAKEGFFSALFDLSFTRLVTTRVIKVLYLLALIIVAIGLLAFIVSAILSGEASAIVVALVVGPVVALLYVVYARVILEVILAIFRILEVNREQAFLTRQQLALMQAQAGIPPTPVPPPVPPQPPVPPEAAA
jgi:hypothetical protein